MNSNTFTLCLVSLAALSLFAACGAEGTSGDEQSAASSEGAPLIVGGDRTFTVDSFTQAGWKKSKQYDTATVPRATEVWYGFINQKNVEIRFYESQQAAIEFGIPSAKNSIEGAVKRSKGGRLLDISGGSFTAYADFVVIGNAVLLCELNRSSCDPLVEKLR